MLSRDASRPVGRKLLTVRTMAAVLGVVVPTLCQALSENAERLYGPW